MKLPEPEPEHDARTASDALCHLIAEEIVRQGGWISFARYMELALYAPTLGYYAGGAVKLGKEGDFTTSPEISPLFGATLAQPIAALLAQTAPQIMEFGAGSGKLANDILTELALLGVIVERYAIVELSGELRARQQALLKAHPQVVWLDALPEAFSGVVIGNEVLDAMPVNLVKKTFDGWCEVGVSAKRHLTLDAPLSATPQDEASFKPGFFRFAERPADAALLEHLIQQIPDALPEGMLTEVHVQATGFMHSVAAMLATGAVGDGGKHGAAIFIDYGYPAHEYYLPQRHQGTLMCHYRHRAHDDPFWLPGLQDITAHVDFTAMANAAEAGGLDVLAYMNQAAFLLASGVGDLLLRTPPEDAIRYLPQANAVQKLLSPAEMGELFKVLVVGKHVDLPEVLQHADRSHRL